MILIPQVGQELGGRSVVVRFARCECEPDRPAVGIDQRMNLAGQPTSRPAHAAGIISITTLMLLYSQSWPNRVSPLVMGGRMGRLLAVGK
jgi:hypothetical protein